MNCLEISRKLYNYNEIISSNNESLDLLIDENCTTDCLAIPLSLTSIKSLQLELVKDTFKKYKGSFVIAVQGSEIPGQIILSSKGTQGLYIGFSYDNVMFASDIYGLVETCKYFYPVRQNFGGKCRVRRAGACHFSIIFFVTG